MTLLDLIGLALVLSLAYLYLRRFMLQRHI